MHERRYAKFIMYMVIAINWMSCIVYMCACPPLLLTDELTVLHSSPSAIGQYCFEDSWMSSRGTNASLSTLYSNSAYFAVVTFMTVGFGDYSAETFDEVIIIIIIMQNV